MQKAAGVQRVGLLCQRLRAVVHRMVVAGGQASHAGLDQHLQHIGVGVVVIRQALAFVDEVALGADAGFEVDQA